jgi:TIR domain-containing protein
VSLGTGETPAPKVFICYRREDTAAHAGRLYDSMERRFGKGNVFMDVDMAPGVDFVERITEVVSACQVLIVVMGPSWATVTDEDGETRIADPDDFVRIEVETALKRPEVTAIPCLVSGARMPKRESLPPGLQALARRNALELSNTRWGYDVERLHTTLDALLTEMTQARETAVPAPPPAPASAPAPANSPRPTRSTSVLSGPRLILEGVLVAAISACLGRWLLNVIPSPDSDPAAIVSVILRRGGTWGLTGAALGSWLAVRTGRAEPLRFALSGLLIGAAGGAIGGLIWAAPVIGHDPNLDEVKKAGSDLDLANRIQIVSLAVTGGFVGALIGRLWSQGRLQAGLVVGALAGALFQIVALASGNFDERQPSVAEVVLAFALTAATIAALTLAALVALDARRAGAALPAPARDP